MLSAPIPPEDEPNVPAPNAVFCWPKPPKAPDGAGAGNEEVGFGCAETAAAGLEGKCATTASNPPASFSCTMAALWSPSSPFFAKLSITLNKISSTAAALALFSIIAVGGLNELAKGAAAAAPEKRDPLAGADVEVLPNNLDGSVVASAATLMAFGADVKCVLNTFVRRAMQS